MVTQTEEKKEHNRRAYMGVVVSDKNDQTIVVRIDRRVKHPLYRKYLNRSKKFHAHDANNSAKVGDRVEIEECRPLSKMKHCVLSKVVAKARI